jgi:hypothetical protein
MIGEARARREKLAARVETIDGAEGRTHIHIERRPPTGSE